MSASHFLPLCGVFLNLWSLPFFLFGVCLPILKIHWVGGIAVLLKRIGTILGEWFFCAFPGALGRWKSI